MKKTLFAAIALAVATMPLTFAQATKSAAPVVKSGAATTSHFAGKTENTKGTKTKKSHKKSTKSAKVAAPSTIKTASAAPVKK